MMIPPATLPPDPSVRRPASPLDAAAIDRLEASFLEEMLKHMGPRSSTDALAGGEGESQFQSFLTQQYASRIAARIDLRLLPETPA